MGKPSLAFVDHSYHRRTRATDFLVAALEREFRVDRYWDEAWQGGPKTELAALNQHDYQAVLFFQIGHYFSSWMLRGLRCRNLISVPMFDDVGHQDDGFWIRQRRYRHLSFSGMIHQSLVRLGIPSLRIQYHPDPNRFEPTTDFSTLRGFFWQRTPGLVWPTIRKLMGEVRFDHFHLHAAADPPGFDPPLPTPEECNRHGITRSDWFDDRSQFTAVCGGSNIYFAPRRTEGIGMAFLEAMAAGKCVVAPDHPTMNEYIQHGKTGLLYDPDRPKPLDFRQAPEIGAAARAAMISGYRRWQQQVPALVEFVANPKPLIVSEQASRRCIRQARTRAWAQWLIGKLQRAPAGLKRRWNRIARGREEKKKPDSSF